MPPFIAARLDKISTEYQRIMGMIGEIRAKVALIKMKIPDIRSEPNQEVADFYNRSIKQALQMRKELNKYKRRLEKLEQESMELLAYVAKDQIEELE